MIPDEDDDDIEDRIAALLAGELDDTARARLEAEIDRHPRWLAVLAVLATPASCPTHGTSGSTARRVASAQRMRVLPGTIVGRYEILSEIGRGGMGVVLEARDPVLRRVVALKLLHAADPARAIREARALARVRHPAVIEVFDVGRYRDGMYIAMERLHGSTLGAWLRERPRGTRAILDVFLAAGEGLAAAHDAALVHRDFKPGNVIVAAGLRVIVLDFGLARPLEDKATTIHGEGTREPPRGGTNVAGTPAYMAPEQRAGDPCDARADQYAFAVALHEALHGHRPGEPKPLPTGATRPAAVARAIDRVLARALASDPADRHPSMRVLLLRLRRAAAPRRSRRVWLAAMLATALAAGVLATSGEDRCERERAELADLWTGSVRARIAEQFAESPPDTVAAALGRVDGFAAEWLAMHEATCSRAPEPTLAPTLACLYGARASARAVIDVLQTGPHDPRTLSSVRALPEPAECARAVDSVESEASDPALVAELETALAESEARRLAGDHPGAVSHAEAAVRIAADALDPQLQARARLALGLSRRDAGPYEDAESDLRAAIDRAAAASSDRIAADAYAELAWVVGYALARHDEGRELSRHADAWSRRVGRPPALEVQWRRAAGWIEQDAGDLAAAREHFAAALAAAERMEAGDPLASEEVAMCLNGLGAVAVGEADFDAAEVAFRSASGRLSRARGESHPQVAEVRNNLATVLRARGRFAEARALLDTNLEVFTAAFGAGHPTVGQTLINRSVVQLDAGELASARGDAERALAVLEPALGDEHPLVAKAHTLRGDARLQMHDGAGALEDLAIALERLVATIGPDHPSVGMVHTSMGSALYELSRFHESVTHHGEALRILQAAWGEDHPDLALVLANLALAERGRDGDVAARALLERAVAIAAPTALAMAHTRLAELLLDHGEAERALELLEAAAMADDDSERDPVLRGATWMALSRALLATHGDPERAGRLATAAASAFESAGETDLASDARAIAEQARDASDRARR